jgi:hypothetical protein
MTRKREPSLAPIPSFEPGTDYTEQQLRRALRHACAARRARGSGAL